MGWMVDLDSLTRVETYDIALVLQYRYKMQRHGEYGAKSISGSPD